MLINGKVEEPVLKEHSHFSTIIYVTRHIETKSYYYYFLLSSIVNNPENRTVDFKIHEMYLT